MAIPTYDLYEVLGVSVDADKATIRRAYCQRIRQLHPDMHPEHERAGLHEQAAKVTTAWEYLADPIKRRAYDATRPAASPGPPSPPPPPRPESPPPPRKVVRTPEAVDFGVVDAGGTAKLQTVWLSFAGGSRIRSARLEREAGCFWRAEVACAEDERSVRIFFIGLAIPSTTPSGRLVDQAHVQLDEVAVEIELRVAVKAAPPPPPAAAHPPPPRPSPSPTAQPSYVTTPRARSGKGKRIVVGLAMVLAVVIFAPKAMHHLGSHDQAVPTPKASGEYCSVPSNHGQMLSFYKAKAGTTERASETPTWVIMVPRRGDAYLAWWTPQFPYWERGNTSDGPTDPSFQYFEVSAVWENGWTPLADVFADYPNLVGGPAAEAAGRQSFITKWHDQQGSPKCS